MAVSWRDALKRAAAPPAPAPARPAAAAIDPGEVSPTLKALLDDRRRMEAEIAGLTGQGGADDPRYPVASLSQRRAELGRWTQARDAARPVAPPRAPEPERTMPDRPLLADRSVAGRMLAASAPVRDAPALRATPGETPAGTPSQSAHFTSLRDAVRADAGGMLDRAFDRIVPAVARPLKGEDALMRARRAIPDDWRERARRMVPDLGEESGYARRAKALLAVAVGSVEDLATRAEKLRDMARDARELKAAEDAGDDRRRDRALERLKAKRQEDA